MSPLRCVCNRNTKNKLFQNKLEVFSSVTCHFSTKSHLEHGIVLILDEFATQLLEDGLFLTSIRQEEVDEFRALLAELNFFS